jgi:Glycosyl hydrolase family 26
MLSLRASVTAVVIVAVIAAMVALGLHDMDSETALRGTPQSTLPATRVTQQSTLPATRVTKQSTLPATAEGYLGVYTPASPASTDGLSAFEAKTGTRPNVVPYYSGWLEPFQRRFADELAQQGAVPLVQIEPTGISLAAVADGAYDSYLATFAASVRDFGHPVIISFGHEMNGDWYSWGSGKTSPAVFVAAWQHLVKAFRSDGAANVTWLWTINSVVGAYSPRPWWPGAGYVNWIGIDSYFAYPAESFGTAFGQTISALRQFTRDPVLITETGVLPSASRTAQIQELFTGARSAGLLGVVYFDANGYRDWLIDNDPAALAAFRQAAQGFGKAVLPSANAPD